MRRRYFIKQSLIGSFVYSDGTFSQNFMSNKTCIGICYYDNGSDRRMISLKFPDTGNPVYSGSAMWGMNGVYVSSTSRDDGLYNTRYIIEKYGNTNPIYNFPSHYPAPNICWNYNIGGGVQWYLPAINELVEIYKHRDIIEQNIKIANGDSLNYYGLKYASSTEADANAIICSNPYTNSQLVYDKTDESYPVRPCAKF